jgi:hypothetical protein
VVNFRPVIRRPAENSRRWPAHGSTMLGRLFLLVGHLSRLRHLGFNLGRLDEAIPWWVNAMMPKPCCWSAHCAIYCMK